LEGEREVKKLDIAVVGAGCAGSYFAYLAAKMGHRVTVFDHSHPREKPCGGAIPSRTLERFLAIKNLGITYKGIRRINILSPRGQELQLELKEPIYTVNRRTFDGAILKRAFEEGAAIVKAKVERVERLQSVWTVNDAGPFDLLIGADGSQSVIRRVLLGKPNSAQLGFSYFLHLKEELGEDMLLRFYPGLKGYGWVFPRPSGCVCGLYYAYSSQRKRAGKLFKELIEPFVGDVRNAGGKIYPLPAVKRGRYFSPVAGMSWALLGEAAMFCDPFTGEGIHYALLSADLLANALKRGEIWRYQTLAYNLILPEILKASSMLSRLYFTPFLDLAISKARDSATAERLVVSFLTRKPSYGDLRSLALSGIWTVLREARSGKRARKRLEKEDAMLQEFSPEEDFAPLSEEGPEDEGEAAGDSLGPPEPDEPNRLGS